MVKIGSSLIFNKLRHDLNPLQKQRLLTNEQICLELTDYADEINAWLDIEFIQILLMETLIF